jgi:hypothetical protein
MRMFRIEQAGRLCLQCRGPAGMRCPTARSQDQVDRGGPHVLSERIASASRSQIRAASPPIAVMAS